VSCKVSLSVRMCQQSRTDRHSAAPKDVDDSLLMGCLQCVVSGHRARVTLAFSVAPTRVLGPLAPNHCRCITPHPQLDCE
jgi:hypothetical protein